MLPTASCLLLSLGLMGGLWSSKEKKLLFWERETVFKATPSHFAQKALAPKSSLNSPTVSCERRRVHLTWKVKKKSKRR